MNSHARRCTLKLKRRNCFLIYIYYNLSLKNLHNNFFFLSFFLYHSSLFSFFLLLFLFEWYWGWHWLRHLCTRHPRNTLHSKSCHQLSQVVFCYRLYLNIIIRLCSAFFKFCWLFYKCSGLKFYEVLVELWTFEPNVLVIDLMYHSEPFYGVYSSI